MPKGHAVLRFVRKAHLYLGIFTTPALLFFAFTGAMQTFSLHEVTPGSSYKPPAWIATLVQIHKKQNTTAPARRPRPDAQDNSQVNGKPDEASIRGTDRPSSGPSKISRRADSTSPQAASPGEPGNAGKLGASRNGEPPSGPRKSHLPLKIFFLLVSVSLILSTLTGFYMSYRYNRGWWQLTALFMAGVVVPLLLLPF